MRKSLRRTSVAVLAFAIAAAYAGTADADPVPNDPFAGEWAVTATPDEATAADGQGKFDEAVLFHDGQFSAAVFAMFGFSPVEYRVSFDNGPASFAATLTSNDRGTLDFVGTQTPTGLDGTLVWTHTDGHAFHYTLIGTRQ